MSSAVPGVAPGVDGIFVEQPLFDDHAFKCAHSMVVISITMVGITGTLRRRNLRGEPVSPFFPGKKPSDMKRKGLGKRFRLPRAQQIPEHPLRVGPKANLQWRFVQFYPSSK